MLPILFAFLLTSLFIHLITIRLKRKRARLLKENMELDREIQHLKKESQKLDEEKERLLLKQVQEEKSGYRGYLH